MCVMVVSLPPDGVLVLVSQCSLRILNVAGNRISNLSAISHLRRLEDLNLRHNLVPDSAVRLYWVQCACACVRVCVGAWARNQLCGTFEVRLGDCNAAGSRPPLS